MEDIFSKINVIRKNIDFLPIKDKAIINDILNSFTNEINQFKIFDKDLIPYQKKYTGRTRESLFRRFFNTYQNECLNKVKNRKIFYDSLLSEIDVDSNEVLYDYVYNKYYIYLKCQEDIKHSIKDLFNKYEIPNWIINTYTSLNVNNSNCNRKIIETQKDIIYNEFYTCFLEQNKEVIINIIDKKYKKTQTK